MNTKVSIALVAAIIVLASAYLYFQRGQAPTPFTTEPVSTAATTPETLGPGTPKATSKGPTFTRLPVKQSTVAGFTALDQTTQTTKDSYPTITGTANVNVGVIISDNTGYGIVGSDYFPPENGHWSYSVSKSLSPGTYSIAVYGGKEVVKGTLIVTQ